MDDIQKKEKAIMEKLVDAHNLFATLEPQHPNDITDWVNAIHSLQRILITRCAMRKYPETFKEF